jgi:hypothetical protein
MDFLFTDEQKAFHEQVLKFSRRELAPLKVILDLDHFEPL